MPLSPGVQLGSHQILSLLGAGGMGEVYRAVDVRLNRQVAIKILPAEYAADAERVARFAREAQAIAALNHPAIAAIYDVAEANSIRYLVLELVEGETLADRLRRGAVPPDEALRLVRGICEALEAAHEKGICHRDLKPANIKLTGEGAIKVLDFGLAKIVRETGSTPNLTNSPTLSLAGTVPGLILGTAGYMSPEQAKGFTADPRSDVFSLGCILYELLTGRQAFEGETTSETLAAVLKTEPDYTRLPPRLHPRIHELLRRCLEKQPKQRWHSAADIRVEIDSILAHGVMADARPTTVRSWQSAALLFAASLLGAAVGGVAVWKLRPERPQPTLHLSIPLREGQQFTNTNRQLIAWAPDGSALAYLADNKIFVASLNETVPRELGGSEGAMTLAFSPDSRSIAFWTDFDRSLKRISVAGGAAITLYTSPMETPVYGIDWSEYGIAYVPFEQGILLLPPSVGKPETIVPPATPQTIATPQMLPGGRAVMYSLATGDAPSRWDTGQVVVQILGSVERKVIIEGGGDARYVPTGHIVYALSGTLLAVPFDLDRLTVTGEPVPVIEGVRRSNYVPNVPSTAQFSFSRVGAAAYIVGPPTIANTQNDLALFDRSGKATPLRLPPGPYEGPRVSPDGRFVAFTSNERRDTNIWVYELAGGASPTRLTFGGKNQFPVWSPDSQWVVYQSDRDGDPAVFRQRADGAGTAERLTTPESGTAHVPELWTRTGERLMYSVMKNGTFTLWLVSVSDRKSTQWGSVQSRIRSQPALSPDGKWIAYQSTETGKNEIFVQPFPDGGSRYMVPSDQNNHHPIWSADGRDLFYIPRIGVSYALGVRTGPRFTFATPAAIDRGGSKGHR
jgi:serine/threonine-protein kinase